MSEMNSLEAQLRSWQARRPSARLKRRLLAEPVSLMPRMAWFAGWLVPATACALLTISVFTAGNNVSGRFSCGAARLSDGVDWAPGPAHFGQGENILLSVTFDLTNRSGAAAAISAFNQTRTN